MRKFAVILTALLLAVFMGSMLMHNKRKGDNALAAMRQYTSAVPVRVTTPRTGIVSQNVSAAGVLQAGLEVHVLAETDGTVLSVLVDVGDRVTAGRLLASIDKGVIESQFSLAALALENAEKDMKRYAALAGSDAVTQQQVEAVTNAYQGAKANFAVLKRQCDNKEIRAPVAGTIASRLIDPGASLMPAMHLFTIVNQDRMTFVISLSESEIAAVRPGVKAHIRFAALPGTVVEGTVRSSGVVPDQAGRYGVQIDVENRTRHLMAGMNGTAIFTEDLYDSVLAVPRACIVGSVKDASLFMVSGDTVALHTVTVRTIDDTSVAVLGGIAAGDTVVLSGQMNLSSGTKVRILN